MASYQGYTPYGTSSSAAAPEANPAFNDANRFETIITSMTVPNIQNLIGETNSRLRTRMKTSGGLKASIVSRVLNQVNSWVDSRDVASYNSFKDLLCLYIGLPMLTTYGLSFAYREPRPQYASTSSQFGGFGAAAAYPSTSASAAAAHRTAHNPAPPPAPPKPASANAANWKESPLFKVVMPVSEVKTVRESQGVQDRQATTISFILSPQILSIINVDPTSYSLRLFCTSSTYQSTNGPTSLGLSGLPMEFPATSEVRVNACLIAASLKGLKKRPGSCPPADLKRGKGGEAQLLRMESGRGNVVELVHVNQQGAQNIKKYFIQVCLVQSFSADALVKKVQESAQRTSEEIVKAFVEKQAAEEDEIEAGAFTLNLKCPLSYVRMSTPVRSKICDHLQCFEASSWFQINEQTPQWACPVCERVLTMDQLFVDGFTHDIIRDCPNSVDDVLVEPSGEWHTIDSKYGTPSWIATNALKPPPSVAVKEPTPGKDGEDDDSQRAVFLLSSDDEDGGRGNGPVSRGSSSVAPVSNGMSAAGGNKGKGRAVQQQETIDLTLSSDEEGEADDPTPPPPPAPSHHSRLQFGKNTLGIPPPSSQHLKRSGSGSGLSDEGGPEKRSRVGEYDSSSSSSVPTSASNQLPRSSNGIPTLPSAHSRSSSTSQQSTSSSSNHPSEQLKALETRIRTEKAFADVKKARSRLQTARLARSTGLAGERGENELKLAQEALAAAILIAYPPPAPLQLPSQPIASRQTSLDQVASKVASPPVPPKGPSAAVPPPPAPHVSTSHQPPSGPKASSSSSASQAHQRRPSGVLASVNNNPTPPTAPSASRPSTKSPIDPPPSRAASTSASAPIINAQNAPVAPINPYPHFQQQQQQPYAPPIGSLEHEYLSHRQTLHNAFQQVQMFQQMPPSSLSRSDLYDASFPHNLAGALYAYPSAHPYPAQPIQVFANLTGEHCYQLSNGLQISFKAFELDCQRRQLLQMQERLLYSYQVQRQQQQMYPSPPPPLQQAQQPPPPAPPSMPAAQRASISAALSVLGSNNPYPWPNGAQPPQRPASATSAFTSHPSPPQPPRSSSTTTLNSRPSSATSANPPAAHPSTSASASASASRPHLPPSNQPDRRQSNGKTAEELAATETEDRQAARALLEEMPDEAEDPVAERAEWARLSGLAEAEVARLRREIDENELC